jgi:hypothetical protein
LPVKIALLVALVAFIGALGREKAENRIDRA